MKRWLPAPLLSVALLLLWVLLSQNASPGTLIMGALLGLVLPWATAGLRPTRPKVRRPWRVLVFASHVFVDMLHSVRTTFWLQLVRRPEAIASGFVRVPLELRDPHALAVLATVFALTPGTAWAEVSLDRSQLLVHVFDASDPEGFIAFVKTRYEKPLMEIFE